jgi:hypothetical protein
VVGGRLGHVLALATLPDGRSVVSGDFDRVRCGKGKGWEGRGRPFPGPPQGPPPVSPPMPAPMPAPAAAMVDTPAGPIPLEVFNRLPKASKAFLMAPRPGGDETAVRSKPLPSRPDATFDPSANLSRPVRQAPVPSFVLASSRVPSAHNGTLDPRGAKVVRRREDVPHWCVSATEAGPGTDSRRVVEQQKPISGMSAPHGGSCTGAAPSFVGELEGTKVENETDCGWEATVAKWWWEVRRRMERNLTALSGVRPWGEPGSRAVSAEAAPELFAVTVMRRRSGRSFTAPPRGGIIS